MIIDKELTGIVHVYGDHVDTDRIIPGKYTKTLDMSTLAAHVLEDLDPAFRTRMNPGDFIVAGDNFGCGSSREQAPLALKSAGVSVVIANYFARIFFRNAINVGLPVLEVKGLEATTGDKFTINLKSGELNNLSTKKFYQAEPLPEIMQKILSHGGLINFLKSGGDF